MESSQVDQIPDSSSSDSTEDRKGLPPPQVLDQPVRRPWLRFLKLRYLGLLILATPLMVWAFRISRIPTAAEPFDSQAVLNFVVPDEQNGNIELRIAENLFVPLTREEGDEFEKSGDNSWEDIPDSIRQWVEKNQIVIELWQRAAQKPDSQPPPRTGAHLTETDNVKTYRSMSRLITVTALRLRADGYPDQAFEVLLCGVRCAHHHARRGNNLERLVAVSIESILSHHLVMWAQDSAVTVELLNHAQRELQREHERRPPLRLTLEQQYLMSRDRIRTESRYETDPEGRINRPRAQKIGELIYAMLGEPALGERALNHAYGNYLRHIDKPRHQRSAMSEKYPFFEPEAGNSTQPSAQQINEWIGYSIFGILVFPAKDLVDATDRITDRHELCKTALALEIYRRQHGEYPDSLDALVPELLPAMPNDLFEPSPKPLKYRREGARATVWSVGVDGIDQGGQVDIFKDYGYSLGPPRMKEDSRNGATNNPM